METKLRKLEEFIGNVKAYKNLYKTSNNLATNATSFEVLINAVKEVKSKVFDARFKEAQSLFEANKDLIKISSFELMQYNFHENTHTNVLQYLFDYRFSGELAINILKSFLREMGDSKGNSVSSSIDYNYYTTRESSIGPGRIDLLIVSEAAKFVIVIENKLLSGIGVKEDEDDDNINLEGEKRVTRTQLTNYKEYINKEYAGYSCLFILLSYKKQDLTDDDYINLDYDFLLKVLKNFKEDNNVLKEYILLLESIVNGKENNIDALERGYYIINNQKDTSLNQIETVKRYFNAK